MITKKEVRRQASHIFLGFLIVALVYFDIADFFFLAFFTVLALIFSLGVKKGVRFPFMRWLLKRLERRSEQKGMRAKGFVFYMIGSTLSVLFFSKEVAMASIVILALGDSVSRLVGPYGYLKHPFNSNKFLEGMFAGWAAAMLGAVFFVPFWYALFGAGAAMLLEAADWKFMGAKIDDNMTIPLISGVVITFLMLFF